MESANFLESHGVKLSVLGAPRVFQMIALTGAIALAAVLLTPTPVQAAPAIVSQPTSQVSATGFAACTPVPGVTCPSRVSFTVVAADGLNPPTGYQWFKGESAVSNGDRISGATSDTLVFNPVNSADFGTYSVRVTFASGTVTSDTVTLSPSQSGPLNVFAGTSAAEVNYSAYLETSVSDVTRGKPSSAVLKYSGVNKDARIFFLPDQQGSASWILFPESAVGDQDGCASGETKVTLAWETGLPREFCVASQPSANSSLAAIQTEAGSLRIQATLITPPFRDLLVPLVDSPYSVNFQVFDDVTGNLIPITCTGVPCPGRPGWSANITGTGLLETIDPLVLPVGSLGKRIRVGALIFYYPDGYQELGIPLKYAALSDPITMQTAGGGGDGGGGGSPEPQPSPTATPEPSVLVPPAPAPAPTPAVVAPEIANPSAVTVQEIESFSPEQVALIPPAEFRQLPPAAIGALSPQQVSALTPAQVNSLRPARAAAITPTAVAAMSPVQLEALRPAAVRALPAQTLVVLDGPQLASLRPDAVARITPRALRALSPAQLRALTTEQRERLTARQLRALDPLQRAALG